MDRELIRAARGLLGWSQVDLAERAGVKRRVVAAYESGERVPHARNLDSLRKALEDAGIEQITREDGAIGVVIRSAELEQLRSAASNFPPVDVDHP